VARRVARALGEQECLLVGGLAVMAHGYVRATQDVDLVVRDLGEAERRLQEQGYPTRRHRGDPLEAEFTCLKGVSGGVRFDVLPPLVPLAWERAIPVPLGRRETLLVVDLDGLIRLKLRAGGPKDMMDVAALVLLHPEQRERAREIATAYKRTGKLDAWLADRRLRAEVEDSRAAEKALRKPARSRRRPRPGV
jgi:hypothetical protein